MTTNLVWQPLESLDDLAPPWLERKSIGRHDETEHRQGQDLRRVGLRRSDTDLWTGVDVDTTVSLPGDGGADGIREAHGKGTAGLAVAQGVQGVGGFARLGDEEADVIPGIRHFS